MEGLSIASVEPASDFEFIVKPDNSSGGTEPTGKSSFGPDTTKPLYLYAGADINSPIEGKSFTFAKEGSGPVTETTDSRGFASLSLDDGSYAVSGDILKNPFNVTVTEGKFANAELPDGVSVTDGGYGLQILTEDVTYVSIENITQLDGISGEKDSSGILITFDRDLSSIGSVSAEGVQFGTAVKQDGGGGKVWLLPITSLADITNGQSITISLANWGSYKVNNTANVTLYKRGEELTFEAEQVGGKFGLVDSTGIKVTFSAPNAVTTLKVDQISLTGAVKGAVEKQGESWIISISDIRDPSIGLVISDGDGYLLSAEPVYVGIFLKAEREITYQAPGRRGRRSCNLGLLTLLMR